MIFIDKLNALCASREIERKVIGRIIDNCALISFFVLTTLAVWVRFSVKDYESGDFIGSLSPWFHYFKTHGGFSALASPVGDYNASYQFFIALMTYIDINELYQFKILSCIFDFVMAVSSGAFVYYITKNNSKPCLFNNVISSLSFVVPYGTILLLPTVILNSAFWAQCDAIYTSFIILSLYFVYKKGYFFSFIFLGCAFAFKLQTVFILPFFFYLYFREKKFSILFMLFLPIVNVILSLPSLCAGLSFSKLFEVYINQSESYEHMYLNYPSFWAFIGDNYLYMKVLAVILTLTVLFVGLLYVVKKNVNLESSENFISIASWSVWTCVMFLPSMHERYAYLLEILMMILLFVKFWSTNRKGLGTVIIVTCLLQLISCVQYGSYFFKDSNLDLGITLILHISVYLLFSYKLFEKTFNEDKVKKLDLNV